MDLFSPAQAPQITPLKSAEILLIRARSVQAKQLTREAQIAVVHGVECSSHVRDIGLPPRRIGKVLDGDVIRIELDCRRVEGSVDLVGEGGRRFSPEEGGRILARRAPRTDLAPNIALPEDTKLWAALQFASGGAWAGCVYNPERIVAALEAGRAAQTRAARE